MKVALVHDWITGMRGGERCLEAFLEMYPDADIYALLHVPGTTTDAIDKRVVGTSFLQYLPCVQRYYRLLLPLFPLAAWSLKLRRYDLVISLSHAAVKNIRIPQGAKHVCYCFTPMRYIWDQAYQYFGRATVMLWPMIQLLRMWDRARSRSVDQFVSISSFISARIRCYYKRKAVVVYPPVGTSWIEPRKEKERGEAFLYAGALVPYKRPDRVIQACEKAGVELWVVGDGPERSRLEELSSGKTRFFGRVSDEELADYYKRSRALIFPGKEDFGIIPIECLAAGRPVIAGYHGALKESVAAIKWWDEKSQPNRPVGVFSKIPDNEDQQIESLSNSIRYFIEHEERFRSEFCVEHAKRYSREAFEKSWKAFLKEFFAREQNELYVKAEAAAL